MTRGSGSLATMALAVALSGELDLRKPLDCGRAFQDRNALAREEKALLASEAAGRRLSAGDQYRLDAIRKRRRQLLVCM